MCKNQVFVSSSTPKVVVVVVVVVEDEEEGEAIESLHSNP